MERRTSHGNTYVVVTMRTKGGYSYEIPLYRVAFDMTPGVPFRDANGEDDEEYRPSMIVMASGRGSSVAGGE